jgi:hypothetical protein
MTQVALSFPVSSFGHGFALLFLRVGIGENALGFEPSPGFFEGPGLDAVESSVHVPVQYHLSLERSSAATRGLISNFCTYEPELFFQGYNPRPTAFFPLLHVPSIRLERIRYDCKHHRSTHAIIDRTLPSLLLVLLPRLDAKQPSARRVVRAAAALEGV